MKLFKRMKAMLLVLTVLFCTVALCACGGNATYQVKVLDGQGNPCTSGVIVKFTQDGKQVAMQPVNGEGVAQKELPRGEYAVELVLTGDNHVRYDEVKLTANATSAEVVLMNSVGGEPHTLFATSPVTGEGRNYDAYSVTVGSTYIPLTANDRNYFLFTPTEAGTYEFSVDGDFAIGYYGAPHFVQNESAAEVTDNKFTVSVGASMIGTGAGGTSNYVIGVDGGTEDTDCVLSILRTGDPEWNVTDEPWTEYKTTHNIAPYTLKLADGEKLTYVDIKGKTENNQIVFNETDGYYHFGTADGPVVLVHLGKGAPYVSLQVVIQGDGPAGGAPIREYFYDDNGDFIKKEDYTGILTNYFDNMDKDLGVYPLNDDLKYIIQNGCHGWWEESSPDFLFEGCNPEIGWMFALCYVTKG